MPPGTSPLCRALGFGAAGSAALALLVCSFARIHSKRSRHAVSMSRAFTGGRADAPAAEGGLVSRLPAVVAEEGSAEYEREGQSEKEGSFGMGTRSWRVLSFAVGLGRLESLSRSRSRRILVSEKVVRFGEES